MLQAEEHLLVAEHRTTKRQHSRSRKSPLTVLALHSCLVPGCQRPAFPALQNERRRRPAPAG